MDNDSAAWKIPIGLQRLKAVNCLTIREIIAWPSNNYEITTEGRLLFRVKEESAAFSGLLGSRRSFNMNIYDSGQQLVAKLRRPYTFRCSKVEVTIGGTVTSVVRVVHTYRKRVLSINDGVDQPMLRVKRSAPVDSIPTYEVQTLEKEQIGCIRKQRIGWKREMKDARELHLTFPQILNVHLKAAVICASLLVNIIDYDWD